MSAPSAGGAASGPVPDAFTLPHTRTSRVIEGALQRIGEWAAWLWVVLLAIIIVNVTLRYVAGFGFIVFEELQWHLYGAAWLLTLSFVYKNDGHVRIDVIAGNWRSRTRAWIELIGILFFLLPFAIDIVIGSIPFVLTAHRLHEISPSPGGLPLRWVIKAFIPIGFGLLALAGFARLLRVTSFLFGFPQPLKSH
ncbi:MAG: TRAP transporter small permease subunit [Rhodospirillales bacterium]|jgi:TRAP-type mannitol/chloroaromatic compound transport system permease small subunit|nr:TRAP transporter small permease subunit [Rhodospirillales bacterium]